MSVCVFHACVLRTFLWLCLRGGFSGPSASPVLPSPRITPVSCRAVVLVFEPEVIVDQLASREKLLRFSEHQFAKVPNSSAIDIDFSLSPEPTKYADILPDRCVEAEHWRGAMDDEMRSMERFGVYRRVPKSAARGRQVLGCRWVYKRKVNKFGQVCRYRARLVAQGFLQRAFDSYQPDETYSPVVHKDTLRMFLSLCAAEDLEVYCPLPRC